MIGTPFIITAETRAEIAEAFDWARAHPVPLEVIKGMALPDKPVISLAERGERPESATKPRQIVLPFGYRIAITCEEQPSGLCLHLSVSAPDAFNRLPVPAACKMIAQCCGIDRDADRAWIEEFTNDGRPGGKAVNCLYLLW